MPQALTLLVSLVVALTLTDRSWIDADFSPLRSSSVAARRGESARSQEKHLLVDAVVCEALLRSVGVVVCCVAAMLTLLVVLPLLVVMSLLAVLPLLQGCTAIDQGLAVLQTTSCGPCWLDAGMQLRDNSCFRRHSRIDTLSRILHCTHRASNRTRLARAVALARSYTQSHIHSNIHTDADADALTMFAVDVLLV